MSSPRVAGNRAIVYVFPVVASHPMSPTFSWLSLLQNMGSTGPEESGMMNASFLLSGAQKNASTGTSFNFA